MTAKEYLSQAYHIDQRINSKLEQLHTLRALSEKATSILSGMPQPATHNTHRMEDVVVEIIDLADDIKNDMKKLVTIKQEILSAIGAITDPEKQLILELRYLCFKSWGQIADQMHYGVDNVYKLHRRALSSLTVQ